MGGKFSSTNSDGKTISVNPQIDEQQNLPDAELSSDKNKLIVSKEELESKRAKYARLRSSVPHGKKGSAENAIVQVYNEDFLTVDHIQAMRFPLAVAKQIQSAVHTECERRCSEYEKTMSRCLQDKMWTTWKCQKERDAYYYCISDEEKRNSSPSYREGQREMHTKPQDPNVTNIHDVKKEVLDAKFNEHKNENDTDFADLMTAYRWKYTLGVFHGEIIGRNNMMKHIWKEHYPDRDLPHPWWHSDEKS